MTYDLCELPVYALCCFMEEVKRGEIVIAKKVKWLKGTIIHMVHGLSTNVANGTA